VNKLGVLDFFFDVEAGAIFEDLGASAAPRPALVTNPGSDTTIETVALWESSAVTLNAEHVAGETRRYLRLRRDQVPALEAKAQIVVDEIVYQVDHGRDVEAINSEIWRVAVRPISGVRPKPQTRLGVTSALGAGDEVSS
jgi:DNA gyrase/topoisomerase IV subunit A